MEKTDYRNYADLMFYCSGDGCCCAMRHNCRRYRQGTTMTAMHAPDSSWIDRCDRDSRPMYVSDGV